MALDPNIILGIKPLELPDQVKSYANMLALQAQQSQASRNALMAQREDEKYQRDTESRNALRDYYRNGRTKEGLAQLGAVDPDAYAAESKAQMEEAAKQAQIERDNAAAAKSKYDLSHDQYTHLGNVLAGVKDQAGWDQARALGAQMFGADAMAQVPAQFDPSLAQRYAQMAIGYGQTLQNNIAQGNLAVGQQNAATAAGRLAWEQAHPASTVVQTADGPMFVDPRNRTSAPVMGANGQPVGAQMQKPPSSIVTAHAENNAVLGNIDDAIAGLDSPGGKNATGIGKGIGYRVPLVGEQLVNWKDPAGMETRALIANIGSKVIHDRSGAAVTISEMPRLAPFIPAIGDKPEQVRKKLELLRQNLAAMQGEFEGTYSGLRPYTRGMPAAIRGDGDPVRNRANSYYGSGNANSQ